jgi:hypothetical protein
MSALAPSIDARRRFHSKSTISVIQLTAISSTEWHVRERQVVLLTRD